MTTIREVVQGLSRTPADTNRQACFTSRMIVMQAMRTLQGTGYPQSAKAQVQDDYREWAAKTRANVHYDRDIVQAVASELWKFGFFVTE